MTWWQFNETIDGWVSANSSGIDEGLSENEENELAALAAMPI